MSDDESSGRSLARLAAIAGVSLGFELLLQAVPWSPWVDDVPRAPFVLAALGLALPWSFWLSRAPYPTPPDFEERVTRHLLPLALFGFVAFGGPHVVLQANASLDRSEAQVREVTVRSVDDEKTALVIEVTSWRGAPGEVIRWAGGSAPSSAPGQVLRLRVQRGRFGLVWVSGLAT